MMATLQAGGPGLIVRMIRRHLWALASLSGSPGSPERVLNPIASTSIAKLRSLKGRPRVRLRRDQSLARESLAPQVHQGPKNKPCVLRFQLLFFCSPGEVLFWLTNDFVWVCGESI